MGTLQWALQATDISVVCSSCEALAALAQQQMFTNSSGNSSEACCSWHMYHHRMLILLPSSLAGDVDQGAISLHACMRHLHPCCSASSLAAYHNPAGMCIESKAAHSLLHCILQSGAMLRSAG